MLLDERRARPGNGQASWSISAVARAAEAATPTAAGPRLPAQAPATAGESGSAAGGVSGATSGGAGPASSAAAEVSAAMAAQTAAAIADFVAEHGMAADQAGLTVASGPVDLTRVRRLASRVVLRRVRGTPITAARTGRPAVARYNFRSDDVDVDRTVAELMANPVPRHRDIWVRDQVPRRRGVVLLLDISGSMRGSQLLTAATAAAAATVAMSAHDELAVIAFSRDAVTMRAATQQLPADRLVESVLAARPHGRTDIVAALKAGLTHAARMSAPRPVTILLTDGAHNCAGDPLAMAARFTRLNVLATTESGWRLERCRALAAAGDGRCEPVGGLVELPHALSLLIE
jgi:Mg-chelatase subunit ChlD